MEGTGLRTGIPEGEHVVLSRNQFVAVLEETGLWGFPREFGSPKRVPIGNPRGFFQWWTRMFHSGLPLFAQHHSWAPAPDGGDIDRSLFVSESLFGDFDAGSNSGMTGDEVRAEVQRTARSAVDKNLDHAWIASGSMGTNGQDEGLPSGFHLVVFVQPEVVDLRTLVPLESGFWRGWKNELSLRSINIECAEPKRHRRIPYSPYSHRKDKESKDWKPEPNFCVPVPYSWVLNGNWEAIRDLSFHPRALDPETEKVRYVSSVPRPTLARLVSLQGWGAYAHQYGELQPLPSQIPPDIQGSFKELNRTIVPDMLCLQELPFLVRPWHWVMLAWIHQVIAVGLASGVPYSLDELNEMCDRIAEEANWEKKANVGERRAQVKYAHDRPYAYDTQTGRVKKQVFTCAKLREENVCVGPSCVKFRAAFPGEVEA